MPAHKLQSHKSVLHAACSALVRGCDAQVADAPLAGAHRALQNVAFSHCGAAISLMLPQQYSCRVRTQREIQFHRLGSQQSVGINCAKGGFLATDVCAAGQAGENARSTRFSQCLLSKPGRSSTRCPAARQLRARSRLAGSTKRTPPRLRYHLNISLSFPPKSKSTLRIERVVPGVTADHLRYTRIVGFSVAAVTEVRKDCERVGTKWCASGNRQRGFL